MTSVRLATAALALMTGCGGAELAVTHVRTGPPLAPKVGAIPVYFNERPPAPYREVGQIRVRARGEEASLDRVVGAAAADARSLGADAIIVDLRAHYHSVDVDVDCEGRPHAASSDRLNARVIAIVFTDGSTAPEPPPSGPPPRRPSRCP